MPGALPERCLGALLPSMGVFRPVMASLTCPRCGESFSADDLGGLPSMVSGAINLDSLGVTAGNEYTIDVFHAERCDSGSNFRIDLSIACFIVADLAARPPRQPSTASLATCMGVS